MDDRMGDALECFTYKCSTLPLPFLGGCYTVQWSDIANSCCVIVWNMRSSQCPTILSSQGLNWASIHWSLFPVSAAFCVRLFLTHEVQKQALRWATAKNSICDLSLVWESISSSCFCFPSIPQCLDSLKIQLRWGRVGQGLFYVRHETSAVITKKMEQSAMRVPAHSKPQPS